MSDELQDRINSLLKGEVPEDDPAEQAEVQMEQAAPSGGGMSMDGMSFEDDLDPDERRKKNLEMILDIPLEVSVELGRNKMLINDLLQLGQGSVIELNKLAGEPLEISLPEGAVFARVEAFRRLNNDGDTVKLLEFAGVISDSIAYDDAPEGRSLELISEAYHGSVSGWDVCVDESGSTPGRLNSISYTSSVPGEKKITLSLTAKPNPFADHVTISYRLPFPVARVSLYVYDRRGRLVARLRNAEESGAEWSDTWDGKSGGSRLPAGPYILTLEALDKRTGRMVSERKTIVAGSKL